MSDQKKITDEPIASKFLLNTIRNLFLSSQKKQKKKSSFSILPKRGKSTKSTSHFFTKTDVLLVGKAAYLKEGSKGVK